MSPRAPIRAILATLAAMAVFTVGDTLMKISSSSLPMGQSIAIRGLFATLIMLPFALASGWRHLAGATRSRPVQLRLVAEVASSILFFSALFRMPIADTTAVLQFLPLALTAAGALVLGEQVGWRRWLATLVGLAGVLIILRPGTPAFGAGSLFAVLAVLAITLRDLATRRVPGHIPSALLTLLTSAAVMLGGLVLGLAETWIRPGPLVILTLACAAATVAAGNFLIILAMRTGELSAVAPFRYSVVPYAILAGYLVWGEVPDRWMLLGTAVVMAAGLYAYLRERVRREEAQGLKR